MLRNSFSGLFACFGLMMLSLVAQGQTFFSPSQANLSTFVFADYWAGNGAALTNTTLVGTDGVQYTFNTGYSSPTPDAFSRSQWSMPFTQNLTGYTNVGLAFQVPAGGSVNGHQLYAQIGLHYNGGANGVGSDWFAINTTSRTNVYLPLSLVPPAQLSQLTSFDIELRSDDPFDADIGNKVNAFTAPAPPSYLDGYQISNFEGSDPGNWGPAFQPDHVHTVVTADGSDFNNGVTKGTKALRVARTYTGVDFPAGSGNTSFRWGSQMALNAATAAAPQGDYSNNGTVDAADYTRWRNNLNSTTANLPNDPTPELVDQSDYTRWKTNFGQAGGGADPVVQGKINSLVDAINAAHTNGRIAFDVSMLNEDAFPNSNPGFLGYELFITDGSGGFYQANFGFPSLPPVGEFSKGVTLAVPISAFVDRSANAFGNLGSVLLQKNASFTIGLSSNTDASATFVLDNFRVQTLAPPGGAGSLASVPEPASIFLAVAVLAIGLVGLRARS